MSRFARMNRYGFETDVFDKYRDAVRNSNQSSLRVFSIASIVTAVVMTIYGLVTSQDLSGLVYSGFLLIVAIFAMVAAYRRNTPGKVLVISGYLLSIGLYLLSLFGAVTFKSDAFWIGNHIAIGSFLLDYAWRIGVLQIAAYIGLMLAWMSAGIQPDATRWMFSLIYFLSGMVTAFTMNRTRVTLIMGREESRRAADTDLLTGLTGRVAAQQEIESHLKTDDHGVMMLMDLDRFKVVNDRLGHQMGDKVLVDVAADLKKMFRNSDVLSRLGGDEFVVYMKDVPERDWALQRADHVVREVRRWVGNGTTNIQVTASVGIVMTDMVGKNYDDLYRAADIAMYTAKHEGGNKALFFDLEMLEQQDDGPHRYEGERPGAEHTENGMRL